MYKFITNNKDKHSMKLIWKVFKISRSSYYKHLNKKESKRSIENRFLEGQILDI
ncbi:hypothetical protein [Anaerosalibacter massiliensis]|uniref:Uncharacterized protein n=1 Tax=Anaerosalibacter massiliensis TaxID=1347392 RepID=A0A9X2MHY5_9FIRM|nr:hypothetical protein [Anaerosalibacter massiliensis]MCR2044019.1 hypothetical protein [Anaerosalibacter massiliensis]